MILVKVKFYEYQKSVWSQTYMAGNDVQEEIECSFNPYGGFIKNFVGFSIRIFPGSVDLNNSWHILEENQKSQQLSHVQRFWAFQFSKNN